MDQKHWKVEKQTEGYIKAVKKTITDLPGGYAEAAEWLGVTENALFNRLRADGDQVFPVGWANVLQNAGGTHYVSDYMSRAVGCINVPLPEPDMVGITDINQKLLEVFEEVSSYSQQVRDAIEDGEVDREEFEALKASLDRSTVKMQQHLNLVSRDFCKPEKVNAPSCSSGRSIATKSICVES
ncbi:hypothetical protein HH682_11980 [Rosenbergiella sp. S61]|uniref:DNA-binding protein n=1 Tax=Rosenbergiella gaditana TaxID=2726987 RepID=A0ABS5SYD7_9GAMM|nr:hypothetical protein [Rosenbergiella gaditana]